MLKNILANWSNLALSILSVFILYPFCIRTLGDEQYGVWLLISSATGYFSLLQMGVPLANVRFISKYHAQKDYEKASQVISTNFCFFSIIAFLILAVGTGLSLALDKLFHIPENLIAVARIAMIIATLDIALRFVFEAFEGTFHAMQDFISFNFIKNTLIIVRVAATLLLLIHKNGLIIIASILLVITFLQSIIFFCYIRWKYSFLEIHKKHVVKSVFSEVIGFSAYILVFNLASRISFQTDSLVIGSVISVSAIVWFNIGSNLLLYLTQLVGGISSTIMPKISKLDALGLSHSISKSYSHYSRLVMLFLLPICLSLWLYGGDFISLWVGEQYREPSGITLSILTIGYLPYLVQNGVAFPILIGTSKMKFPTLLMCAAGVANLGLSIWWGKIYGIYGVAWGTTIPTLLLTASIVIYMCRTYSVSLRYYLSNAVVWPLSGSISYLVAYHCVKRFISIDGYLTLSISVAICMTIYSLLAYWTLMPVEYKKTFENFIFRRTAQ
jgi:O-antigen/teichoic acid export membrane protein